MISKQRTTESITYSKAENLVQEFASRGVAVLCPDSLGVPSEIHQRIYEKEKKAVQDQLRITPEVIPEIFDILDAPGLVAACDQLVGKNWAIVPFIHNAPFISGARDQHWHKDDNAPYNARKQRHHQAIQIEMLYYPQDVSPEMGPTAIVPFSHYWTFNHEENHDNFAGADHIDFGYLIEGLESIPVSGPDSKYTLEDIIQRKTKHDRRMVDAVSGLNWPLTRVFEVAPLRAGSILLYSHNTFHRGNHRRDDWRQWTDNPRFMWRFWIYRTNEPSGTNSAEVDWCQESVDPLTGFDLSEVSSGIKSIWRYHKHWLETGKPPSLKIEDTNQSNEYLKKEALQLFEQMLEKGDEKEPIRIGAAYELAAIRDQGLAKELLRKALLNERESVRRAGTYGLVALGTAAEDVFLEAIKSPTKWLRKAGIYGLGEVSILNKEIFEAVKKCLLEDPSKYVRSVAAGSLGCLGRRTIASGQGLEWILKCIEVLLQSLQQEENRLAMDRAQKRNIKFVRPTDECDVCEGMGIDFGIERFEPVRSSVRENILWALVMLCSHGEMILGDNLDFLIEELKKIIHEDRNVITVGFAMDALSRLAHLRVGEEAPSTSIIELRKDLETILNSSPIQCWESLVRSGLRPESSKAIQH